MNVPAQPKIYHIVHVDKLQPIIKDDHLWCDAEIVRRNPSGTSIGMSDIKRRRLDELKLTNYPDLHVGDCVPFYFCPRSIMLYIIHQANHPGLSYRDGQKPIVHLEADLHDTINWADRNKKRWAFTLSNAGSYYFEDRVNLDNIKELDWEAIKTNHWSGKGISSSIKEGKQAEFLVEYCFPWHLVERIGVYNRRTYQLALHALDRAKHRPSVEVKQEWYY